MKKLAITALAVLLACPAFASVCTNSLNALAHLEMWGMRQVEAMQFPATDDPNITLDLQLWVNSETGEWVFFKVSGGISCILIKDDGYDGQTISMFLPGQDA